MTEENGKGEGVSNASPDDEGNNNLEPVGFEIENLVDHDEALSFSNYFIKGWDKEAAGVGSKIVVGSICIIVSVFLLIILLVGLYDTIIFAIVQSDELTEVPAWVNLVLQLIRAMTVVIFFIGCYYLVTGLMDYRRFTLAKKFMLDANVKLRAK